MRKAHVRKLGILTPAIFGFLLFYLPAKSEQGKPSYSLHAIVFESYLAPFPETEKGFDTIDLPSNEFPWKFSLLCAPFGQRQTIQLPRGVVIPQQPMFLDIYTFRVAGEQIQRKKRLSRYNGINDLKYKIRFLSWSGNRYQIELEGRHENFKFNRILVEAAVDKTKIVRIRRSVSHTLYVALTPIEQYDPSLKGFVPPTLISKQQPVYPSELRKKRWSGTIRIHAFVTREGRIGREEFVFLECPHYLFARNSLDAVLNQWIYKPATRDGVPIDSDTTIDVGFTMLRPVVQSDLQR
jgi:hypothetical protein